MCVLTLLTLTRRILLGGPLLPTAVQGELAVEFIAWFAAHRCVFVTQLVKGAPALPAPMSCPFSMHSYAPVPVHAALLRVLCRFSNHPLIDTQWEPDPDLHWSVRSSQLFVYELMRIAFYFHVVRKVIAVPVPLPCAVPPHCTVRGGTPQGARPEGGRMLKKLKRGSGCHPFVLRGFM